MFNAKMHMVLLPFVVLSASCSSAATDKTEKESAGNETTIYANEYGEIHLTPHNEKQMHAVFFDNNGQTFDTLMEIDYNYTIIHNDSLPFLWLETGGIKVLENRLEVYDFAGPAYMQMYTKIPEIYEHAFYKINETVVIRGAVEHPKGGELIDGIYVIPACGEQNHFVEMTGVIKKEKYPRDYYATSDGPQGMFADTNQVHYRLVIEPVDVKKVEEFVYEGHTLNVNGEAAFIWDFADSEAYYLDNHAPWTEEELNKKLKIEAVLVQFEMGRSVLKSWTILE